MVHPLQRVVGLLTFAVLATAASAEDVLRTYTWDALKAEGRVVAGEVVSPDAQAPFHALKVAPAAEGKPGEVTCAVIAKPGVPGRGFALAGRVRHEGTTPKTYIEMLVHGPPGGPYFSRHEIAGTSGWTPFRLPFRLSDDTPSPERLTLRVLFAGGGTVHLGPIELRSCAPGEDPFSPGAWWDGRTAGILGGVFGGVLGAIGAGVGLLAVRGRAPRLVLGMLQSAAALGFVLLAWGVAGLVLGQPYAVWYPLLLAGTIGAALGLGVHRSLKRRYAEKGPQMNTDKR
jgi:hypothetical protein